jgi:hypothetical protein
MNPLELRYLLHKALTGSDEVLSVTLVSPSPGKPVQLEITTSDPYAPIGHRPVPGGRSYRVSVEEV